MRHALSSVLFLSLVGCGSCGACGSDDPGEATRPPPLTEEVEPIAEPEPEPDPCVATDAELAEWDEEAMVGTDELPTGAGGEPLGPAAILQVGDEVYHADDPAGSVEEAVAALEDAPADAFPEGVPVPLALRATDPISRIAPLLLHAFDEGTTFALIIVQTDRATECRALKQVTFGLKTDEDHGWVTLPTSRPVSDLLVALGGADIPRRVQLLE